MLTELFFISMASAISIASTYFILKNKSLIVSCIKTFSKIYHPSQSNITILPSGKSAKIVYQRYGNYYSLIVPYRRDLVSKMSGTQVWYQKGTERHEITQQSGIPYQINLEMLGADCIIIKKNGIEKILTSDQLISGDII